MLLRWVIGCAHHRAGRAHADGTEIACCSEYSSLCPAHSLAPLFSHSYQQCRLWIARLSHPLLCHPPPRPSTSLLPSRNVFVPILLSPQAQRDMAYLAVALPCCLAVCCALLAVNTLHRGLCTLMPCCRHHVAHLHCCCVLEPRAAAAHTSAATSCRPNTLKSTSLHGVTGPAALTYRSSPADQFPCLCLFRQPLRRVWAPFCPCGGWSSPFRL